MSIDDQWQSWQDNNPLDKIEAPDTDTLKEAVIKDLILCIIYGCKRIYFISKMV